MEVTEDRLYAFTLTGFRPMLMHANDVMAQDETRVWQKDSKNRSVSVAGDDRSPAWTWQTYLYHDGEHVAMPQDNIMVALRTAGTKIKLKGMTTFKEMTQSNLFIRETHCEFLVGGGRIPMKDLTSFRDAPFSDHVKLVRDMGFALNVKRASVNGKGHVRVRPEFSDWAVRGTIEASDPALTDDVLSELFTLAGKYAGLGDWRPSSPRRPGPYGTFHAEVTPITTAPKKSAGKKAG